MRLLAFITLSFIISIPTHAYEQYSEQHCNALKKEKEQIQERFARGYGVAEGNYLNDRDREIFRIMRKHCVKPVQPNSGASYRSGSSEQLTINPSYNADAINDNWSAQNRIYEGEKLKAWEQFYKMPAKCRHKQSKDNDFVACADDKAEQRKQFEAYWRNRIKLN